MGEKWSEIALETMNIWLLKRSTAASLNPTFRAY